MSAPIVVVIEVAPLPETSPLKVIVSFSVKYVEVSILRVPFPPLVLTKPLSVKFESIVMLCEVSTLKVVPAKVNPIPPKYVVFKSV